MRLNKNLIKIYVSNASGVGKRKNIKREVGW